MKKSKWLMLILIVSLSINGIVFAQSSVRAIKAYINDQVKMTFNGEFFKPTDEDGTFLNPIIYNNRSYLPVRAIAEKAGLIIGYDKDTNTISISTESDSNNENNDNLTIDDILANENHAQSGDWIYYQNTEDGYKLYKIKTDGTSKTKLNDKPSWRMSVVGDWIYYAEDEGHQVYKIKIDGSNKTKIGNVRAMYLNIVGDWMYYAHDGEGYKLYKAKIDGTEETLLDDNCSCDISVIGEWIYYIMYDTTNISSSSDIKYYLYRIKTDGTQKTKLVDGAVTKYKIKDGWIYYDALLDSDITSYKMKLDGTEKTQY
ncbi:MAG: DUF5050 domain-containing protein [Deltaproteobacteria bacterium]